MGGTGSGGDTEARKARHYGWPRGAREKANPAHEAKRMREGGHREQFSLHFPPLLLDQVKAAAKARQWSANRWLMDVVSNRLAMGEGGGVSPVHLFEARLGAGEGGLLHELRKLERRVTALETVKNGWVGGPLQPVYGREL